MDFLIAHKQMVMTLAGILALEVIPRVKPGWKPATKWVYDLIGKIIPDKQSQEKLK